MEDYRPLILHTSYLCRSCKEQNVKEMEGVFWCDDCGAFYVLTTAQKKKRDKAGALLVQRD